MEIGYKLFKLDFERVISDSAVLNQILRGEIGYKLFKSDSRPSTLDIHFRIKFINDLIKFSLSENEQSHIH